MKRALKIIAWFAPVLPGPCQTQLEDSVVCSTEERAAVLQDPKGQNSSRSHSSQWSWSSLSSIRSL